ncbi:hypothetical protein D3C75_513230 [compost metagenome]
MRLINQQHRPPLPLLGQAFEADPRVIYIVIVADHCIAGIRCIQRKFERTDLMPPRIAGDNLLCHQLLMLKHVQDCPVDPVIIALSVGAALFVAYPLLLKAGLVFGGNRNDMQLKPLVKQHPDGILGCQPVDGLGRQIEQPRRPAFPHCLECRKEGRHRFSNSRRRLCEQINTFCNRLINRRRKMPLSAPVSRKRKPQRPDTAVPLL